MHPELFKVGFLVVHTYGVLIAVGIFISVLWARNLAKKTGFPSTNKVFDLLFVVVVSGFIGGRIFYVLQEWDHYREHFLEIFAIWEGGLVYYGGVLGAIMGHFLYVRYLGLSYPAAADFVIPFIALTHAFGRVGCFFSGCCYGKNGIPVQLFEAAFNFALFGFLLRAYGRRRFPGEIFASYLLWYPAGRFFFEFLRGDQIPWFFSLTLQQILSLVFILLGVALYGICRHRA